jgi:hypothetical protein
MWLKLGSYSDLDSASEIISTLRECGIKWELKECIEWDMVEKFFVRGRLSELKKYGYEEIEEWERYVRVLRDVLKEPVKREEFEELFFSTVDPEGYELAKRFLKGNSSELNDEEFYRAAEAVLKHSLISSSIYGFLQINGVEVGDYIQGELPEDPEIILEIDDGEDAERIYAMTLIKSWDVYVNCLSLIDADIEKLKGRREFAILNPIARLIASIIVEIIERRESSYEEIEELASGIVDGKSINMDGNLIVDGSEVLDEILKTFEKSGWIKKVGDKIRWKGRS